MSEKKESNVSPEKPAPENPEKASGKTAVKKGRAIVLGLIGISLLLYLLSDRFTPYTSQARVQGYVVGVAPNVAGSITEVWVSNNQEVEKGDPLFKIDPAQYEVALQKAVSDLETARRQVNAGSASVDAARANLLAAQANERKADQDYTRQRRLREEDPGTISQRRLEISKATLEQARAQVTGAEAGIQQAIEQKGGINDADNATIKSAESAVENATRNLNDTIVRASSRGVITDLRADVGQYAGTGSPVLTIISVHDVWITAEFKENNLGHLKPGSPVEILFDVLPGRVFSGEVRSIGLGVSDGSAAPTPGTLPSIQNNRDWMRQAQRFPVVIGFDVADEPALMEQLRIGGQASVIGYSKGHVVLNSFGKLYIRLVSFFSYAY